MTDLIKYFLPWVIIFILGWLVVAQPSFIFSPDRQTQVVTDTVFVDKPFEVEVLKEVEVEVPYRVTIYETVYDTITKIETRIDTVLIQTPGRPDIIYHPSFLTQNVAHPKLLNAYLSISSIEIVGLFPNGQTRSSAFDIDLNRYNYMIGITDMGNIGIHRERIGVMGRIRRAHFNEAFLGYDFMTNLPTIQYRTGFNGVYQGLGLEGQIELTDEVRTRVGVNYRF